MRIGKKIRASTPLAWSSLVDVPPCSDVAATKAVGLRIRVLSGKLEIQGFLMNDFYVLEIKGWVIRPQNSHTVD